MGGTKARVRIGGRDRRATDAPYARAGKTAWFLLVAALSLATCTFPGYVRPTVKIGLSAPFEGLYRDLGYEVLHAVRLAVRQRNTSGGLAGRYYVELVALNDLGEPDEAVRQAREMASDPDVLAVVGGFPLAAPDVAPEYEQLGLAYLEPPADAGQLAAAAAQWAVLEKGVRRAVVVHGAGPQDKELARQMAGTLVSYETSISVYAGDAQADAWLEELRAVPATLRALLFMSGSAQEISDWLVRSRSAGYAGLIMGGPALANQQAVRMAGAAAEGAFAVGPLAPPSLDPMFGEAFAAASGGSKPGPAAGWAYEAADTLLDLLEQALHAGRGSARDAVRAGLRALPRPEATAYLYVVRDGVIGPVEGR